MVSQKELRKKREPFQIKCHVFRGAISLYNVKDKMRLEIS
jgi:hypothetical protein